MITGVVIIILSLAMFVYWFRYSCLLILESDWNEEQANVMAVQSGLAFGAIKESLACAGSAEELDRVKDLLDRDLEIVLSLLSSQPEFRNSGLSLESRMLMLEYQFVKAWFAVTRSIAGPSAQQALRKMAHVVSYIAGECGDHLATARG